MAPPEEADTKPEVTSEPTKIPVDEATLAAVETEVFGAPVTLTVVPDKAHDPAAPSRYADMDRKAIRARQGELEDRMDAIVREVQQLEAEQRSVRLELRAIEAELEARKARAKEKAEKIVFMG